MNDELLALDLTAARDAIAAGDLDPRALLDAYAAWVEASMHVTGAFLAQDFDLARTHLSRITAKQISESSLYGIPLAVKDIMHVVGFPTTCGSKMLENYRPPFAATVVERLTAQGAVIFGKLNMDEFAMGSSNENSAFGPVRNPWDLTRVPGGSSGGSAAAVAARQTIATLGSDTGGSIRQPAALCGITGLKPTYGRVSRYGLVAFASSLDQIGPMARSAADCALLLAAIAGHDPRDATSASGQVLAPPSQLLAAPNRGLKIGLPRQYFGEGLNPEVRAAVDGVADWLKERGHTLVEVDLKHTDVSIAVYYIIATAEASSNFGRYDGVRYGLRVNADNLLAQYEATRGSGFGPEVKRRIMLGTFVLSRGYYDAYYLKAQRVRSLIAADFTSLFAQGIDALLTPTTPATAFKLGEKIDDPLTMYLNDIYTSACNLAGIPGISFPCGFDARGLPIGAQLMANHWREDLLLGLVHAYQQDTDYHRAAPRWVRDAEVPA